MPIFVSSWSKSVQAVKRTQSFFVAGTPADKVIRHALPECDPLARKAGEQALRPRIVTVDAGDVTLVEKPRLRVAVGLHRAVVVEVILRQVRENTDAESDSFYPALHQRVGRDLHHGIGAARIDHLGKQALHGQRVGRCAVGRDGLVADQILICADQADLRALCALQKSCLIRYVVVVLPFVPVTPTTVSFPAGVPYHTAAQSASALCASGTKI